jgi:hypothetical protein
MVGVLLIATPVIADVRLMVIDGGYTRYWLLSILEPIPSARRDISPLRLGSRYRWALSEIGQRKARGFVEELLEPERLVVELAQFLNIGTQGDTDSQKSQQTVVSRLGQVRTLPVLDNAETRVQALE